MADDVAMVERIYEVCRPPSRRGARQGITAFMETTRGGQGTVVYQPEVLGIDPPNAAGPWLFL